MRKDFLITHCNNYAVSKTCLSILSLEFDENDITNIELHGVDLPIDNLIGITGAVKFEDGFIVALQGSAYTLAFLDCKLNIKSLELIDRISDIHGILVHNDFITLVSTGNNSIFDLKSKKLERRYNNKFDYLLTDVEHINDIAVKDERIIASSFGARSRKGLRKGRVYFIDTDETIFDGLNQPHSVCCYDNVIYVLDSLTGSLLKYDAVFGLELSLTTDGYARGLFINDDFILIGNSKQRLKSRLTGTQNSAHLRADIQEYHAGIHVYDRRSNGTIFVKLNFFTDEVYGIVAF